MCAAIQLKPCCCASLSQRAKQIRSSANGGEQLTERMETFSLMSRIHESLTVEHIERSMHVHRGELTHVVRYARLLRDEIDRISDFIQFNTSAVCPACEKVCCINKHGYYDHEDLIYVFALGLERPVYGEGMDDTAPCQFLSRHGCSKERSVRPFRCNWYFCDTLLAHMERGPAKPYREFISRFQGIIETRRKMIDEFSEIARFPAD